MNCPTCGAPSCPNGKYDPDGVGNWDEFQGAIIDNRDPLLVIVCGRPDDGLRFYGPFLSSEEAETYQNTHLYAEDWWWISELQFLAEKEVADE